MLASWRGARFEVVQVLRDVVDAVLKEPGVSDVVLMNRAKVRICFVVFTCFVPPNLSLGVSSFLP